jgi:ACR3 family arsenite transporter
LFERYLSLWVALCIVAGVALGHLLPGRLPPLPRGGRAGQSPVAALVG